MTYPPSQLPKDVRKLKGFIWREEEQPKKMEDIFLKKDAIDIVEPILNVKSTKSDFLFKK
jgi:hypothetical protein